MSGLEFFRKMLAGEMPPPPMLELLGIRLVEVEEGRVVFTGDGRGALLQRHRRRARRLRGDAARHGARLRDQLGDAGRPPLHDARTEGEPHAAAHAAKPAQLRCEAKVVHVGGRTATSEGRIVDRNGKLYAHGTTTCIVVDAPRGTSGTITRTELEPD